MDFALSDDETAETMTLTKTAYDAWVLVNDYFSWDKEWKNHQANGSTGMIASAVFLYMKWYSVDAEQGRKLLRKEIIAREDKYCRAKDDFLARGKLTEKTIQWLDLLDLVTAGNFAWSMTTARYDHEAEDSYPTLRAKARESHTESSLDSLSDPISLSAARLTKNEDFSGSRRRSMDAADSTPGSPQSCNDSMDLAMPTKVSETTLVNDGRYNEEQSLPQIPWVPSLYSYEKVSLPVQKRLLTTNYKAYQRSS